MVITEACTWLAELTQLENVVAFVEEFADKIPLPPSKKFEALIVVEEAFVNVCHYAYPDKHGEATISCTYEDNRLIIEIIDQGVKFDLLSLPEPDTESALMDREIGGLGVHFIRKLTDLAHYHYEAGQNILRLEFIIHALL